MGDNRTEGIIGVPLGGNGLRNHVEPRGEGVSLEDRMDISGNQGDEALFRVEVQLEQPTVGLGQSSGSKLSNGKSPLVELDRETIAKRSISEAQIHDLPKVMLKAFKIMKRRMRKSSGGSLSPLTVRRMLFISKSKKESVPQDEYFVELPPEDECAVSKALIIPK